MFKGVRIAEMNDSLQLARVGKGIYNRFGAAGEAVCSEVAGGGAEGYENYLVHFCGGTKDTVIIPCRREFGQKLDGGLREILTYSFLHVFRIVPFSHRDFLLGSISLKAELGEDDEKALFVVFIKNG